MRGRKIVIAVLIVIAFNVALFADPNGRLIGWGRGEPFFEGRSASAWAGDLGSTDSNRASAALEKLATGKEEAVPVLSETLSALNPEVRWRAVEALGRIGAPAASTEAKLLPLLADPDSRVRTVVAQSLAEISTDMPGAVAALVKALPNVEAIRGLAKFGPKANAAIPQLIPLTKHEDRIVRWNAIRTLGKIGPAAAVAVPEIQANFQHADSEVREHAAEAIGDIGPGAASALPELAKLLKDSTPRVQRDTLRSIGLLGKASLPYLAEVRGLKTSQEAEVKAAAEKAERQITGEPNQKN
ncbi:MAG: HEAT repeat domain-containing protein [Gemmataceae bacterium]